TGAERAVLSTHRGAVRAVAVRADGGQVVSAGVGGEVRSWTPGGAAAAADGEVRVWDSATGRAERVWRAHDGVVRAIAYSPDGRRLATGGHDGLIRIFDLA